MKDKRITITGGKGFLGRNLSKTFQNKGYDDISVTALREYNLIRIDDVRGLGTPV
jgi:nucleoside-diphosphate-sugar epimerase